MADAALRADGVSKRYGERAALRDVTFAAGRGELVAIIGPNGAGKTTLLQIARGRAGAERGHRVAAARARSAGCRSSPRCTRSSRWRRTCGCSRAWRRSATSRRRSTRMLEQTDLAARAGDEVGRLSGGNQQRVNIAIGLLRSPAALLLDEPSASLDPRQRERLWGFIGGLAREGTAVVYSTHDVGRGRALRRPRARPGRRRAAVHGHAGRARARRRRRRRLRVAPSSASSTSAATERALAAAQGPADPAPLAAAGRAADRLPDRDLAAGRARARPPARRSRRSRSRTWCRRARASSRSAAASSTSPTTRRGCSRRSSPCAWTRREEAIEKVRSGEVLGAMVIPADAAERLRSTLGLGGGDPPQIEVYYNASDPLKQQLVETTIQSRAGRGQRRALGRRAARGGRLHRRDRHRRGGRAAAGREHRHPRPAALAGDHRGRGRDACRRTRPSASRSTQVARFARLAADNLDVSKPILAHDRLAGRRQADQRQRRHDAAEQLLRARSR